MVRKHLAWVPEQYLAYTTAGYLSGMKRDMKNLQVEEQKRAVGAEIIKVRAALTCVTTMIDDYYDNHQSYDSIDKLIRYERKIKSNLQQLRSISYELNHTVVETPCTDVDLYTAVYDKDWMRIVHTEGAIHAASI